MQRDIGAALIAVSIVAAAASPLAAQPRPTQPPGAKVRACSLLTKAEVKQRLPWRAALDNIPVEEEPLGPSGSSCNYPSVLIQVMPYTPNTIATARKTRKLETLAGIGDEAYFYDNPQGYAEIYVKAGTRLLTVQANADRDVNAVKPGAIDLAKALVAKLR